MTPRTMKTRLAASVALNLFAVAAGTTLFVTRANVEHRLENQHRALRDRPFQAVIEEMDPQVRERVRDTLRASALAGRPDFDEARLKRREAVALAGSAEFDPARVIALLEQSRTAELRGRARLEADAVALLETLEPADRAALSEIMTRRGRTAVRGKNDRAGQTKAAPAGS